MTPEETVACRYMADRGYEYAFAAKEKVEGDTCWYFFYMLPDDVEIELEVSWDQTDGWRVRVTDFSPFRMPTTT
jgi:hypothetical protein